MKSAPNVSLVSVLCCFICLIIGCGCTGKKENSPNPITDTSGSSQEVKTGQVMPEVVKKQDRACKPEMSTVYAGKNTGPSKPSARVKPVVTRTRLAGHQSGAAGKNGSSLKKNVEAFRGVVKDLLAVINEIVNTKVE